VGGPLITPDGSKAFVTSIALGKAITVRVEAYSVRTGQRLASVTPPVTGSGTTVVCEALWTDPSGRQLTALCEHAGVIDGTRFSQADLHLPAGTLISLGTGFAW